MKISKIVEELTKIKREYGDVEVNVFVRDLCERQSIDSIEFIEGNGFEIVDINTEYLEGTN